MSSSFELWARGIATVLSERLKNRILHFSRIEVDIGDHYFSIAFYSAKKRLYPLCTFLWDITLLPSIKEIMKQYRAWKENKESNFNVSLVNRYNCSLFWLTADSSFLYLVCCELTGSGLESISIEKDFEDVFIDKFLELEGKC